MFIFCLLLNFNPSHTKQKFTIYYKTLTIHLLYFFVKLILVLNLYHEFVYWQYKQVEIVNFM